MCSLLLSTSIECIFIKYSDYQIFHFIHHTGLKNIFQKLIVSNCSASLNLNNDLMIFTKGISCKILIHLIIFTKQYWHINLLVSSLTRFYSKV